MAVTLSCPKKLENSVERGVQSSSLLPGALSKEHHRKVLWDNPLDALQSQQCCGFSCGWHDILISQFSSPLERADDWKCQPFPEISVPRGGCAGGKLGIKSWGGMEGEQRGGRDVLQLCSSDVSTTGREGLGQNICKETKIPESRRFWEGGDISVEARPAFLTQTGSETEPGIKTALELSCGVGRSLPVHFPYLWVPKALGRVKVLGYQLEKELQAGPPCSGPQDSEYLPK